MKNLSVTQARRILGSKAKQLNDDQIRKLINNLSLLALEQMMYIGSKEANNSKGAHDAGPDKA